MVLRASNGQCYSHNITQVARHMKISYAMFILTLDWVMVDANITHWTPEGQIRLQSWCQSSNNIT